MDTVILNSSGHSIIYGPTGPFPDLSLCFLFILFVLIFKKYLFIYLFILAAPGLSCGMRDL